MPIPITQALFVQFNASRPIATLRVPVLLHHNDHVPIDVLLKPVVLFTNALKPIATLQLAELVE